MKRSLALILSLLPLAVSAGNIYIDSAQGSDTNEGTSISCPLRTLKGAMARGIASADSLLLKSGQTFRGTLRLTDKGPDTPLLTITTYGGSAPAIIDAKNHLNGILIQNSSNIRISHLAIRADGGKKDPKSKTSKRCGIFLHALHQKSVNNIHIHDVDITDIFYEPAGTTRAQGERASANGTQSYGWGIRGIVDNSGLGMSNLTIDRCHVSRVSHTGIRINGSKQGGRIRNLRVTHCDISETGGPGMQFSSADSAYIGHNSIFHSGSVADSRNWSRGSGIWTWSVDRFLIEHNSFVGANGPGDSAGAHIDFNCRNVVLQYNYSADNAGGFIEILGNCHNCSYRYNVSVNDGYRIKGENGAFQEGKTLWLSGFVGQAKRTGPFNCYIYNNTIYTKKDIAAKMAVENTVVGALIANNIFCIESPTTVVPGDQYTPEKAGESEVKNVFFKNNLYLHDKALPKEYTDHSPLYGSPEFVAPGSSDLAGYAPQSPAARHGLSIQPLPDDTLGLYLGLDVTTDILGNPVGQPFIGAIAPKQD